VSVRPGTQGDIDDAVQVFVAGAARGLHSDALGDRVETAVRTRLLEPSSPKPSIIEAATSRLARDLKPSELTPEPVRTRLPELRLRGIQNQAEEHIAKSLLDEASVSCLS
jgi:hypothetical protein